MRRGRLLATGRNRQVYQHAEDPGRVVKVARAGLEDVNRAEFEVWERAEGTVLERWLAPCVEISEDGRLLVMEKTQRVARRDVPDHPEWFTDTKSRNWGRWDGRVVLHDYGQLLKGLVP